MEGLFVELLYKRAYREFLDVQKKEMDGNLEKCLSQIQQSFRQGFEHGRKTGFSEAEINLKIDMMVKLIIHTDLDSNTILTILDKQDEELYIQKIEKFRKVL
ncbi:hypothetical protein [Mangrovibacillus cuniculi]|uniref:Uncharacterized protein n=1 Tax=Mangrovibacillus cuniculi TaxID=2593652 RepID=A0A7S8HGP6_9BACI|nr:hypothetical protein [Mangrovibacillus cuniculi]QPC48214.1 hypothetical protein G8O30_15465 [Mangrovibacillus cuniculi]